MRSVWWGLLLTGLVGCSTQAVNFEHQSELEVATRGLALNVDGLDAFAGMYTATCRVDVFSGNVGEDYDIQTDDDEAVGDAGILLGETAVLVISDDGTHLTYPDRVWDWASDDFDTPGAIDGRVYGDGIVVLTDDGVLEWHTGDDVYSVLLPADAVANVGLTVTDSGTAFVATGNDVIVATEDGSEVIGGDADIAVWDHAAEVLYVATAGSDLVRALEEDGTERWSLTVDGSVVSMDAMGPLASAAVMVEHANGTGELMIVDGWTGEVTSTLATPSPADEVRVSDNGQTLAMVLSREVHFFNVKAP